MGAVSELEAAWTDAWQDDSFRAELDELFRAVVGRPTPLFEATRLSEVVGARVLLKREDLAHTGAHKINNTVGQVLLAVRMGKTRIIAETGAGQHGVATATACAYFGLPCVVYMGAVDVERQHLNVVRMELLGAEVIPVEAGTATLKDAVNEALRDWVTNVEDTHYVIGSVVGPHPYPDMVASLQQVIGEEARRQCLQLTGALPDAVVACVGGGSNAIGLFRGFYSDDEVRLIGVEAGGEGGDGAHGASITRGSPGILHGARSMLLQTESGQIAHAHSISAGLDYPGVGPEHAALAESGRASYISITDAEALDAFGVLSRTEGIIPALEPAHAIAHLLKDGAGMGTVLVGLSGARGQGCRFGCRRIGKGVTTLLRHLEARRSEGRKLLVPYFMAGVPDRRTFSSLLDATEADAIEVGIPFSDPLMDGPVVAMAGERALANGIGAPEAIDLVAHAPAGPPRLLMTYYNPIHKIGETEFCAAAASAGVSGLIVPDLPLEESESLRGCAADHGLAWVGLVAPTSSTARVEAIAASCTGFVYAVSTLGVTGVRSSLSERAAVVVDACRAATDIPILIGIGVSTPEQAREAASSADGVVIGSAVVRRSIEEGPESVRSFLAAVRSALDAA